MGVWDLQGPDCISRLVSQPIYLQGSKEDQPVRWKGKEIIILEGNNKNEREEVVFYLLPQKFLPYNTVLLTLLVFCMTLNDTQGWRARYSKGNPVRTEQKGNLRRTKTERAARSNSDVQKYIYFQQFQNHCLFYSRNIQMEQ